MRKLTEKSSGRNGTYVDRVNRAIDYVLARLDQDLSLEVVAREAGFSLFHFHRIFQSSVGESLQEFVKRVRLERAVMMLPQRDWAIRRKRSITDVALACGFTSSADFSRSFKQRFGVPPSRFDVEAFKAERRGEWQTFVAGAERRHLLDGLPPGENPDKFAVTLRTLPARCVAYIRVVNSYREGVVPAAAQRLVDWAENREKADGQWLGYAWDDPEIVAPENCRYDVGLEVSELQPEGEVGRFEFPPMLVAELEIRGAIDLEMRALDWLYRTWLPGSGYVPTDQPCFEAWIGRPFAHGMEYFELKLQLPVERG